MDTVLAELFYRECLTGLSNPGSRVSYRGPMLRAWFRKLVGRARRKCSGRRSSDGDEKRRRNLKRWKIAASGPGNSRTRVSRTNFVGESRRNIPSFPIEAMYLRSRASLKTPPRMPRYLCRSSCWCFGRDIPRRRWFTKKKERKNRGKKNRGVVYYGIFGATINLS